MAARDVLCSAAPIHLGGRTREQGGGGGVLLQSGACAISLARTQFVRGDGEHRVQGVRRVVRPHTGTRWVSEAPWPRLCSQPARSRLTSQLSSKVEASGICSSRPARRKRKSPGKRPETPTAQPRGQPIEQHQGQKNHQHPAQHGARCKPQGARLSGKLAATPPPSALERL